MSLFLSNIWKQLLKSDLWAMKRSSDPRVLFWCISVVQSPKVSNWPVQLSIFISVQSIFYSSLCFFLISLYSSLFLSGERKISLFYFLKLSWYSNLYHHNFIDHFRKLTLLFGFCIQEHNVAFSWFKFLLWGLHFTISFMQIVHSR